MTNKTPCIWLTYICLKTKNPQFKIYSSQVSATSENSLVYFLKTSTDLKISYILNEWLTVLICHMKCGGCLVHTKSSSQFILWGRAESFDITKQNAVTPATIVKKYLTIYLFIVLMSSYLSKIKNKQDGWHKSKR